MNKTLNFHTLTGEETLKGLNSSASGLTDSQADELIKSVGANELIEQNQRKAWRIFLDQLFAFMQLMLIGAAIVSLLVGSHSDSWAILAIVFLFAVLGFFQEYRAEKALAALKKMAVPLVRVRRDNKLQEISAVKLVPGDIVLLEAGNIIPADCRLLEAVNLKITESALTGESQPSEKEAASICPADKTLADRNNMAYMGTIIAQGRGTAVITATGMNTELGKIATILQNVQTGSTPLQKRLNNLGKALAFIGVAISVIIIIIGLTRGEKLA
ncbi:MAG: HAD-IC family P-type ATPase, partial [Sedimentisphaerales bacterium]|nr:HAD-IC family P-type ATPase [Sedimentisphaerales bacterium]